MKAAPAFASPSPSAGPTRGMLAASAALLCALFASALLSSEAAPSLPAPNGEAVQGQQFLPGVELAEGLSQLTGVAISPLWGICGVGAWQYYRTPEAMRPELPWFCQPLSWGVGFSLLAMCLLKDLVGPVAPTLMKKPLDAAELFENKVSSIVACAAFVPFLGAQILESADPVRLASSIVPDGASATATAAPLLATAPFAYLLLLPVLLAVFLVVWLVGHSVNVLLLLSPFGIVDSVLKAFRAGALLLLVGVSAIHPVAGALLSLCFIGVAILLAPWAFRLAVFGSVMAGDAFATALRRSEPPRETFYGFLCHRAELGGNGRRPGKAKAFLATRTLGRVSKDGEGMLWFTRCDCFPRPSRRLGLGPSGKALLLRGMIFPSLAATDGEGNPGRPRLALLPRYRHHLESMRDCFGLLDIRDNWLRRGLRGSLAWLRETVAGAPRGSEAPGHTGGTSAGG